MLPVMNERVEKFAHFNTCGSPALVMSAAASEESQGLSTTNWFPWVNGMWDNNIQLPVLATSCDEKILLKKIKHDNSYTQPVIIQWQSKLNPSVHWNATGERIDGSQVISSVSPVCFQWSPNVLPVMRITTGLPLGHHWVIASAKYASSGLPMCYQLCDLPLDCHWDTTGW